jgi:pyridine nucleotide-disulfide oxidoreductase family protein
MFHSRNTRAAGAIGRGGVGLKTVLLGGGHVHIGVLRRWLKTGSPPGQITLISPSGHFSYSGMLPGWIAGHYPDDAYRIDLAPLTRVAGVAMHINAACRLDMENATLWTETGAQVGFDILSIGTGGVTDCSFLAACGDRLIPAKPVEELVAGWRRIRLLSEHQTGSIAVVGGGAAAVELAAAMAFALRPAPHLWSVTLVGSREGVLAAHAPGIRHRAIRALKRLGVTTIEEDAVGDEAGLLLSGGDRIEVDWVVAATGVRPPTWLQHSGLAMEGGYPVIGADQRSVSHAQVFAAGDVSARDAGMLPKAGVQAVRQAPILADNLIAAATGRKARNYHPRARSLYLIALGDRRAILTWGRIVLEGRLMWRLKDWIDRRYVGRWDTRRRSNSSSNQA